MYTAVEPQLYGRGALAVIAVLLAAAAVLLFAEGWPLHGILLAAVVIAPIALYLAFTRPLVFPFGLYVLLVPFDNLLGGGSHVTLTKLLGIVTGACLLFWTARRGAAKVAPQSLLVLSLLVLWMFASAFWALDQSTALQIMPTYAGLVLLYVALSLTPVTMKEFNAILACVVCGGLAAAGYGANFFFHHPALAQNADTARLIIQIGSSSIDPNHFANSLLFPAIALAVCSLRTPMLYAKVAGIAGVGFFVTAILLSGSREALIAFGAVTLYLLWRSRQRIQVLVAVAATLIVAQSVQTSIWQRFASAMSTGGSGRTDIWAVALDAAKHRPLFGYGIGNFQNAFDVYYLAVHQAYVSGWSRPAHNIVFHYLVEIGVVGLVLVVWFFWREFRSLASIERGSQLYDYRVMLECALIAIVIVSLSIDLFTYKYAWLVFSAIALFRNAAADARQSEPIRAEKPAITSARPLRC